MPCPSFSCSFVPLSLLSTDGATSRIRYFEITRPIPASEDKRSHFTDLESRHICSLLWGLGVILLGPFWVHPERTHTFKPSSTGRVSPAHTFAEPRRIPAVLLLPTPFRVEPLEGVGRLFRGPWDNLTLPSWPERIWLLGGSLWHLRGVQGRSSQVPSGLHPSLAV